MGLSGDEAVSDYESDTFYGRPGIDSHAGRSPVYFPVSIGKFILMSVVTGGLYELYWSYRNWSYIKQQHGLKILPFWRAWFTLFFHYDLLKRMKVDLGQLVPVDYSAGWLTVAYVLLNLAWRLPDPFFYVAFLAFLPVLPVVGAVNAANLGAVSPESMNSRLSGWNILAVVLFAAQWFGELLFWLRPDLLPS
jgi:hypothetical protein